MQARIIICDDFIHLLLFNDNKLTKIKQKCHDDDGWVEDDL